MPLKPGSSRETISKNIREFHTGETYAKTSAKFGKAKANKQAIAVALSTARKYKKKALGGPNIQSMVMKNAMIGLGRQGRQGLISSSVPGRTDKLPMNVRSGSYILPADIPSALGQGNTIAGGEILKKMFSSGPYGLPVMKGSAARGAQRMGTMRFPAMPKLKADGGEAEEEGDTPVSIIAAGGEYIIDPEVVRGIGSGSVNKGHKVLDQFVLSVRKDHIKTLKGLKPPKK